MKIYLFRHAQKAMDFTGDPDLTPEGHAQASKLLDRVIKKELTAPTEIWASPKKRTLSTLRPLAQHFSLELKHQDGLLEQQSDETLSQFRARIQRLLDATTASSSSEKVIFLCSHYDWVIEAMAIIPCDQDLTESEFSNWTPCQYVAFEVAADGLFKFLELKRIQI